MTNKYRSKLEKECHELLGNEWEYEPKRIAYIVRRNYTPDFVNGKCYIEVAIAEQLKAEGKELIFLMPQPDKKTRKGGKITYRDWCAKYDIPIFSTKEVKELKEWTRNK